MLDPVPRSECGKETDRPNEGRARILQRALSRSRCVSDCGADVEWLWEHRPGHRNEGGGGVGGVFELDAANGAPLPFLERSYTNDTQEITEGRLQFVPSLGSGTFLFCRRITAPDGTRSVRAITEDIGYDVTSNGALTITYRNAGARSGAADVGTVAGTALSFQRTFEIPARTYSFHKTSDDPFFGPAGCTRR